MLQFANTNNLATKPSVFLIYTGNDLTDETGRIALTTEPDLCAAIGQPGYAKVEHPLGRLSSKHNTDDIEAEKVDAILRALYNDSKFRDKYNYWSLFLIGSGSYGSVFRVVSIASGPLDNPVYDEHYVCLLQSLRRTKSRKKIALLDSYRDSLCLDLVAIKIEALTPDDVEFRSANKVQLIKEFLMLTEIFRNSISSNVLVGFPLPIEFGFLTGPRASRNLRRTTVFDKYGRLSNYRDAFLGQQTVLNLSASDVTCISFMTMELLGPNLDEWKKFFAPNHSEMGSMVFSVQTTLKLMDQVLCRLLVMHRGNMVHLDLKPDNVCMGIGKMANTVYLLDYGLSRICSDEKPNITFGSRRYMSVGVLDMMPANYMMDIESWFYVLIFLLTEFVPWSDDAIQATPQESDATRTVNYEEKMLIMAKIKRQFWGDDGHGNKKVFQRVIEKAEFHHKKIVPDIAGILTDIYAHIWRMRRDFYRVSCLKMHADIRNEESDLFKRYHTLRKLLLFPYNCDFSKGGCFSKDKDLAKKQEKRRAQFEMLTFTLNSRNWLWDWDLWFEQDFVFGQGNNRSKVNRDFLQTNADANDNTTNSNPVTRASNINSDKEDNSDDESDHPDEFAQESPGIPNWMRHYLARVLVGRKATTNDLLSSELATQTSSTVPRDILVAG